MAQCLEKVVIMRIWYWRLFVSKGKEIKIRCEDNFQQWMIAHIN